MKISQNISVNNTNKIIAKYGFNRTSELRSELYITVCKLILNLKFIGYNKSFHVTVLSIVFQGVNTQAGLITKA